MVRKRKRPHLSLPRAVQEIQVRDANQAQVRSPNRLLWHPVETLYPMMLRHSKRMHLTNLLQASQMRMGNDDDPLLAQVMRVMAEEDP